jgi:hypothetical protein
MELLPQYKKRFADHYSQRIAFVICEVLDTYDTASGMTMCTTVKGSLLLSIS